MTTSITWDTPQNISGAGDVSTTGTLVGAANVGDTGVPSTTVNGVNFQSFAAPGGNGTSGMFTMTAGGGGVFQSNTGGASPNAPFSSLDLNYQTLLSSYVVPLFSPVNPFHDGPDRGDAVPVSILVKPILPNVRLPDHGDGRELRLAELQCRRRKRRPRRVGDWHFYRRCGLPKHDFIGDGDGGFLNGFQLRLLQGGTSVPESGSTLALLGIALSGLVIAQRKLRAGSVAR